MDNQEEFTLRSRAEYIQIARESCSRNLSLNNTNKNHGNYKEKDKYTLQQKPVLKNEFKGNSLSRVPSGSDVPVINIKLLLIRIICASLLFLAVFLIDKFELGVKGINSTFIKEMITNNQGLNEAQDFFVTVFEDFIKTKE